MQLETPLCLLRPWQDEDLDDLVLYINDKAVWRNLSDIVPHPYTHEHADEWISRCQAEGDPPKNLAIIVDGSACGAIGFHMLEREKAHVANVGYWLGKEMWGRGIATASLGAFVDYIFDNFPIHRLHSSVYGWNPASAKVLEKNGFILEGRLKDGVLKDGQHTDELLYGRIRDSA